MKPFLTSLFVCLCLGSFAQNETKTESNYDPHVLFSPLQYPIGETATRTATGEPNNGYWQNRADYQITASLDDISHTITGSVTITYKNNSPHKLPFLWLQLDQNLFNKESTGRARWPVEGRSRYGDANSPFSGGYSITAVKVNDAAFTDYVIADTRMQVRLAKPLAAGGLKWWPSVGNYLAAHG